MVAAPAVPQQLQSSVDAIPIDLLVHDKKNRPVLDLTGADIAVSDSGVPVQLTGLHLVTPENEGAATINLVFDHMDREGAKIAHSIAAKLLPMLPDHSSLAVFGLDRGLRLFLNFTQDRAAVASAASRAITDLPRKELTDAEKQLLSVVQTGAVASGSNASVEDRAKAHMMLNALEGSQRTVKDQQAMPALAGLLALCKTQQNLPGRKIVVVFSEGLRANSKSETMTREVVQAANRGGIAIYTVDTNAVDTKSMALLTIMNEPAGPAAPRFTAGVSNNFFNVSPQRLGASVGLTADAYTPDSMSNLESDRRKAEGNSLAFLATGTGGFAISAGDNPREPLQRLVADLTNYYEATYTPALKEYDGHFHSIDIKPMHEGMTVLARAGYFALEPGAAGNFSVRPYEAPLLKILGAEQLPADVQFQQTVLRMGAHGGRTANELVVELPVTHLELHQDQRTLLYSMHVSLLAQIRDQSGVVVERFSDDIARNGALETVEDARAGFITLQRPFTAAPGSYVLEAVVMDQLGEKAGALRTTFALAAADSGPWLSDVVLVRRTEPLGSETDLLEPLEYAKARVVPNLVQQVTTGTPRISFFFRSHADSGLSGQEGKLDVDVQRDGKSVSHSSMAIAHPASSESSVNMATVEAVALEPGSYRAIFTYAQKDKSSSRELGFTVAGTRVVAESLTDEGKDVANQSAGTSAATAPVALLELAPDRFTPAATADAPHPPSQKYQDALLASARERAVGYLDSLMNFRCIEVTDRYVDPKGTGAWAHHDKLAEMLTYENHEESRKVLEVDGQPGNSESYDMKSARLEGEFGGILKLVFDPSSQAVFEWKQAGSLDGAGTQVFGYRVDLLNSRYSLVALPKEPRNVAFHGLVYIDDATRGVRRITIEAEGIPERFPVRASAIAIDYDYVAINNHDYLMPVRGEMQMKLARTGDILHRIEFRDYHRFGSDTRIVGVNPQ
jgi:VWFA-related protein